LTFWTWPVAMGAGVTGVENDGEQDAPDFRLAVELPTVLVDGGGYISMSNSDTPGFSRFGFDSGMRNIHHLYPCEQRVDLITFHYVITGMIKRESRKLLQKQLTATVYSGNMTPHKTVKTIDELRS
jgi:hypothetical protein